ncbi:Fur family transcriptional regulator [Microlunatus sp. Gsoil 973]|jgi:Fur family ferric uptake transcriptional regulator|uniref:Fur family transcriptional regulator n=1 Tax=Microlunatus sp. Gsoil 973 TaxID=2672569 RepID=UPI0012B4BF1B|nr:Fur family transcriptional regulator [Microlunatus sp. Gsoil 973]QGN34741.1 helix-turn-helix domain-containing protein [Microlunatus sp. Gsoil 973]
MPESPLRTVRPVATVDEAVEVLREDGGRVTKARRAILDVLFEVRDPLSVEQIARRAAPELDVPSTYRNLEHLETVGLVRHVHFGHGPGLYELVSDHERWYALCESCGAVTAFSPADLDPVRVTIDERIGYQVRFAHFPLVGLCRACQAPDQA